MLTLHQVDIKLKLLLNSLRFSDIIWRHRNWSRLDPTMIAIINIDSWLIRFCGIYMGAISQQVPQLLLCRMSLKITLFMMTPSNGNIFCATVTGLLCGEFTGPGEFPTQRPVTRSFDVYLDLRLNKRLSKQWWGWWFATPSWSLWCQCNVKLLLHLPGVNELTKRLCHPSCAKSAGIETRCRVYHMLHSIEYQGPILI